MSEQEHENHLHSGNDDHGILYDEEETKQESQQSHQDHQDFPPKNLLKKSDSHHEEKIIADDSEVTRTSSNGQYHVDETKPEQNQVPAVLTLSEDRMSKDSAIQSVCLQRKKDSFNQLKVWEEKRGAFLLAHKKIVENVLSKIEKRIKISHDSMAQVVRFFKERRDQESTYSKVFSTKVPHLSHCWRDPGDQTVDWYPSLSKALKETDDSNDNQGKNVSNLVLFLEKNIIKDLLFHENEDFEKKIKVLKTNISDQVSRLEKAASYSARKNSSYAQLYSIMVTDELQANKLKKKRKDLLNLEIKFRQAAFDEINEQKTLGQQILSFWEETRKLESLRIEVIQKVFQLYITKHSETYGSLAQMQATLQNFQGFDCVKETEASFSVALILGEEDQASVRRTLQIGDSTPIEWADVVRYVTNFNFKDMSISQHSLVQKKFKIMRDVGSVTKSFKECWMVATVDDILLFYDEINQKQAEMPAYKKKSSTITEGGKKVNNSPKKKFRLDCIKVKQREDRSLIDIIEKTPGLIFESTSKQLIKFVKEDDFEEFKVFMLRYQSNSSDQK